MTLIHKHHFLKDKKKYLQMIKKGRAFIYPTDTIYGIGCDATNQKAVKHVHALKQREKKPFSVIAPSKQWIQKNCIITKSAKKWIKKLPGKYTFILHLKNKKAVAKAVHLGDYTIGVRIPKHWIAKVVAGYCRPIVTTSVNISGQPFMQKAADVPHKIKEHIAFILYEGPKKAHPSTIVDFVAHEDGKIKKR
ncbi:threonylcarbamoyl-AMP synthase [Candidatus Woesearchaeota archaeon]|nr:threonylcarbamoyl-AMP synthase [Candidatus Woesearchaeota archaeon]